MTYKKTSTVLTITVIAAFTVSASVLIALTMITEGVGISHAVAKVPVRAHTPQCPHYNPTNNPPCKPLRAV